MTEHEYIATMRLGITARQHAELTGLALSMFDQISVIGLLHLATDGDRHIRFCGMVKCNLNELTDALRICLEKHVWNHETMLKG